MVNDSLTNLSCEELAILYMKYFLKKSDREIGTLIGISSQAVSKRKRKIVQKIRKKI
ncbi:sigma factor-like helix-turn-helix DNA-binding protein [Candidatus Enterococcus testudinis]|uniref:sigma factor-like helix-turn-helix DNA-binding protein n=1 Tax=Candidatus Enterococcus testudinis TaxID=1834191 RepID=UPI00358E747B